MLSFAESTAEEAEFRAKKEREALGLPEFHCKFNYMHVYFSKDEIVEHEKQCELNVNLKSSKRLHDQKEINSNLETAPLKQGTSEKSELF